MASDKREWRRKIQEGPHDTRKRPGAFFFFQFGSANSWPRIHWRIQASRARGGEENKSDVVVERVVFLGRSVICADEGAWYRSRVTSLKGGNSAGSPLRWKISRKRRVRVLSLCLNLSGETGAHPNHTQPHPQENALLLHAHNILSSQGSVYTSYCIMSLLVMEL